MEILLSILAFVLPATVPPSPSPTPPPAGAIRFDSHPIAHAMPIEIAGNGLPFVRGRIRDSDLWFLLDTASPSVLSVKAATRLGLEGESGFLGGRNSESKFPIQVLHNVTVRLAGVELDQPAVSSFDLDLMQTALGHPIDGILGTPFFESFVVVIDYSARRLELRDPKHFRYTGRGHEATIARDGGFPYVRGRLKLPGRDRLEGDFLVDTGADSAALLFSPFVTAHRLLDPAVKTDTSEGFSAEGANFGAVLRAEWLELGPFQFREPIVELSRSTKGLTADPHHAGLLGGAVLSRFRTIWDYARNRMILEVNARYRDPFPYDASGVSLSAQGPDLSTFEIRRVAPGSPGAQAGLAVGDVVLAIDGRPVKEITLRGIRQLFSKDGQQYVLSVLREGEIRRLTLKCRRLL
jgi:predicted aspartyl protease